MNKTIFLLGMMVLSLTSYGMDKKPNDRDKEQTAYQGFGPLTEEQTRQQEEAREENQQKYLRSFFNKDPVLTLLANTNNHFPGITKEQEYLERIKQWEGNLMKYNLKLESFIKNPNALNQFMDTDEKFEEWKNNPGLREELTNRIKGLLMTDHQFQEIEGRMYLAQKNRNKNK